MGMRKTVMTIAVALAVTLVCGATPKILTSDPLTGLPLIPATDSRLHLGNEPTVLPEGHICKSKMETNFYAVFDTKMKDTVSWYESRLTGFKKTVERAKDRTEVTLYKSDGTVLVNITSEPGAPGSEENTHSVVYAKFTPPVSERNLIEATKRNQNIVCP
jgi:hypothetical protein